MNKKIPYVLYGIIFALCAPCAIYAYDNPYAVFSMGGQKAQLPCVPFSQLAPITFENRPSLRSFEEEIHRSMELEKKEFAAALPQITVSGFAAHINPQPVYGVEFASSNASIHISQLIWSFAGPIQKYAIQRSNTSAREEDEKFHRTVIRLESEQTFLDAYLYIRQQEYIKALNASSRSVFALAENSNRIGFLSDPQWKQTESDFISAQMQVLRYQDNIQSSYSYLERSLSIPLFTKSTNLPSLFMDTGLLKFTVDPIENYLEKAIHLRHDLASKAWEVDLAEKQASFLLNTYAPVISFTADAQRNSTTIQGVGKLTNLISAQFGITASWQFDSFASAHDASANEAESISLKMQQLDLSLAIQRDVKAAYYDLQALLKDVEAEKARYITAEAVFQQQEQAFNIGQISEVDYTVAITNLKSAQYALDKTMITAEKKYRDLLFACGYPPEFESSQNLWSHK